MKSKEKYIPSTKHEWSKMDQETFEDVNKRENLEKFNLKKFKITEFCIEWANQNRGNIVRYITNRNGKNECRGGGVLLMLGLKESKSNPTLKVPEFIMIRNAYNTNIKPFSVQIKNIVSLWFSPCAPKRIVMNTPVTMDTPVTSTNIEGDSQRVGRSVSPKSPRSQNIRKIRA